MPRDSQSHPTPALLPMIPLVTGTLVERKKQKQTLIFRNEDHSWMKREKGRGSSKSKIFRWVFPSGVQTVPWHHQSTRESTRTEKKAHTNVVGNSVLKRGQRRRFSGRSLLSKKKKKSYSYRGQNKNKFNHSSITTWWHRAKCDTAESKQKSREWEKNAKKIKHSSFTPCPLHPQCVNMSLLETGLQKSPKANKWKAKKKSYFVSIHTE